jgi:protein-tyrosine kinase
MSLVEQAIARLRQANKDKIGIDAAPVATPRVVQALVGESLPEHNIQIDLGALRANGYLPEASRERQFAEHYRQIKRPLIEKALSDAADSLRDYRFIMVTSAMPGDGKTFTAINLALSMARERDISVLLVDGDTPKRHVTEIFGLRELPGLTDALSDEAVNIESLVVGTNVPGLSILPSGQSMDGAAELLSSSRMRQLIASLTSKNPRRVMLVDSPPLLITSEGRAVLKVAGQAVLVVRASHTPQHAVEEAVALFDTQQAGGIVLNQVEAGLNEGYYRYSTYGSYGVDGKEPPASG